MNNGVVEMGLNLIPAGYKQTEVGVIPEDWVIEKLGVIGKFKNGINKSADDFGYGYPFVNLMDVFGKPEIIGDEHFGLINSTELDKKEYSLVQGDVLFIRSSVKPSGVGLTTVVMSDLMDTVYSGFLIRFRTDNQLVIEFKKHCFYEESFRNRVICASTISANTNINQDSLKDIYLVYPSSKKEQTAIANALSDVDALISELEKLIAKKQAIKTATMQQLLTGRTRLPQFALREDGTPKG
jgi:type I restriction enzyme S subunit